MSSQGAPGNASDGRSGPVSVERLEAGNASPGSADLLERVLQATLSATADGQPLDPAELAALRDVARRHRGAAVTLPLVADDLVQTLLRVRFANLEATAGFWRAAVERIAGSLLDDPTARDRLQALWAQLSEAAA